MLCEPVHFAIDGTCCEWISAVLETGPHWIRMIRSLLGCSRMEASHEYRYMPLEPSSCWIGLHKISAEHAFSIDVAMRTFGVAGHCWHEQMHCVERGPSSKHERGQHVFCAGLLDSMKATGQSRLMPLDHCST